MLVRLLALCAILAACAPRESDEERAARLSYYRERTPDSFNTTFGSVEFASEQQTKTLREAGRDADPEALLEAIAALRPMYLLATQDGLGTALDEYTFRRMANDSHADAVRKMAVRINFDKKP